ncbi:MAG: hypothetical protein ACKOJF_14865, partial [Planctomycetaceae bacterium]
MSTIRNWFFPHFFRFFACILRSDVGRSRLRQSVPPQERALFMIGPRMPQAVFNIPSTPPALR